MKSVISKIANDLKVLTEDFQALSDDFVALEKLTHKEDKQEVKSTEESQEEKITIESVRAALSEKSKNGKVKEVKALIKKYGADKLTSLDPSCYKDLLKEAENI